jgi:hypothetical protein
MIKTFTPEDVVRYHYNELENEEKADLEQAMLTEEDLGNFFFETSAVKVALDAVKRQPRKEVIDNILLYSATFARTM